MGSCPAGPRLASAGENDQVGRERSDHVAGVSAVDPGLRHYRAFARVAFCARPDSSRDSGPIGAVRRVE